MSDLHPANIVVTKRLEDGRHEFGICDTNGLAKTRMRLCRSQGLLFTPVSSW